jgi:hypothetical protein
MQQNHTSLQHSKMTIAIAFLYKTAEENDQDQLFWETLAEPYRSVLEDCYHLNEEGKFSQLKQITNSIKYARLSYIKLGVQLYQVKYYKLYQGVYNTFKNYCEQAIKYQVWRANQVIESARVAIELIIAGFKTIPVNETQARYLINLNSEKLTEKWQQVLNLYPPHKITAERIEKVVIGERKKKIGTLKLPIKILEEIEYKALEYGITPKELIIRMIRGELFITEYKARNRYLESYNNELEKPSPEAIKTWEKDLEKLVYEKSKGKF